MSDYINKALADWKKHQTNQIMQATRLLVVTLKKSHCDEKVWAGYRKKIRRIL